MLNAAIMTIFLAFIGLATFSAARISQGGRPPRTPECCNG